MRRIVTTCLTLVAAALLVLPAAAMAAPKKGPAPQITRVQPMRISVGGKLTITGRRFRAQRNKNTIIFRSSDGRTAFVKPLRATSRKLVLRVPASVVAKRGRVSREVDSALGDLYAAGGRLAALTRD